MTTLNLAQEFFRADILREHFKQVPDDYLALPDGGNGTTRIRCVCGVETDLAFGQIESCECGRIFWCGSKVYAAPPEDPDDHACAPGRVWVNGRYCLTDYCADCGRDL